jgi:hypothetical protein
MRTNSELAMIEGIQQLDIADGLKKLLIEKGLRIDAISRYSSQEVSDILHIDPYVSRIIIEEAQKATKDKILEER